MPHHSQKNWQGGHATMFPFESKSTSQYFWLRDCTTLFPFLVVIPHTIVEGASGHTALSKGIPCVSQPIKGRSTWAKCKKHARNTWESCKYFQWLISQLCHLPPLLYRTRVLPVLLSCRDNGLVLGKKLSKFHKPPLKSFVKYNIFPPSLHKPALIENANKKNTENQPK